MATAMRAVLRGPFLSNRPFLSNIRLSHYSKVVPSRNTHITIHIINHTQNHSKSYVYSLNYQQELQQYTATLPSPTIFFSFPPRSFLTPTCPHQPHNLHSISTLDKLLESAVNRRAQVRDVLVEVHRGDSALGDALWGELELLYGVSVIYFI